MNPPNPTTEQRQRLANAVATFRDDHGLTQVNVTNRGGPSVPTLRRIERGTPVDDGSLNKLDHGLGWAPGTAQAILDGTDVRLPDTVTTGGITIGFLPGLDQLSPLDRERVIAAAREAALERLAEIDAER